MLIVSAAAPDFVVGAPIQQRLDEVHVQNVAVVGIVLQPNPEGQPALVRIRLDVVGGRRRHGERVGGFGDILTASCGAQVEHVAVLVIGIDVGGSDDAESESDGREED